VKLFIEPVDVWLFRDGRPFDAGSDHRAASLFPPPPTVMQGAVRSYHLIVAGVDLRDAIAVRAAVGTAEDYRNLRLRGPFLARREEDRVRRYLPVPADALLEEAPATVNRQTAAPANEKEWQARPLRPEDLSARGILTSAPTPRLLWSEGGASKREAGWMDEDAVVKYLKGAPAKATPSAVLFKHESRIGLELDDSRRTATEHALYEVQFVRPAKDVGLDLEVEGLEDWPPTGMMQVGGERRAAYYGPSNSAPWPSFREGPDPLPARFKLLLATPACFAQGWQPATWSRFFDGSAELVAAALHRYEALGGYDLAKGEHKPSRRYVPAGSVYFFESNGRTRLRSDLLNDALTDWGAEIGFGQFLIGSW